MGAHSTYYVYVVCCADGSLYTGISTDVERRVKAHNELRGAKYTRTRLPVKLVYVAGPMSKSAALVEEHRIKRLPRAAKLNLVGC